MACSTIRYGEGVTQEAGMVSRPKTTRVNQQYNTVAQPLNLSRCVRALNCLYPYIILLSYFFFQPLEVVSGYRDPQLQELHCVTESYYIQPKKLNFSHNVSDKMING